VPLADRKAPQVAFRSAVRKASAREIARIKATRPRRANAKRSGGMGGKFRYLRIHEGAKCTPVRGDSQQ
jgi:hypothetical protein